MKVSFVVLHYLAHEMTSSCIDALLLICEGHDANIVVVDNASDNGSGTILRDKYSARSNVHFILLQQNEGFARGNNVGYKFAVEHFSPDFIVVMNNDVIIDDPMFIEKIGKEYSDSSFAVLGPDIFCPITGEHQNPAHLSGFSENELLALRERLMSQLDHFLFKHISWKIKLLLGMKHSTSKQTQTKILYKQRHTDCVLHGACYIFSRDFIAVRKQAFNPGTFLYFEEDILHYECLRDGLIVRYSPDLCVTHFEDTATKMAEKIGIARERAKKERMLQSIDVMLNIIHNDSCR